MNDDYNENFARAGLPLPPEERTAPVCHKGPHLLESSDTMYFVAAHRKNPQAWKNYYQAREDYLRHMRTCVYCSLSS